MSDLYSYVSGPNAVVAVKMAIEDSGLTAQDRTIEVLSGDYQNKPDVGIAIAGAQIEKNKVDAIADSPNSGVALAITNVVRDKIAVLLNMDGASTAR